MSCGSCVNLIERTLKKKNGVKSASVALSTGIGRIEYDSFVLGPRDIMAAIHVYDNFYDVIHNSNCSCIVCMCDLVPWRVRSVSARRDWIKRQQIGLYRTDKEVSTVIPSASSN